MEHDIKALADRAREDREFATELYGALCNADWRHDDGTVWGATWRYAGDLDAYLRGCGESYLDFDASGREGEISARVALALNELGWRGVGHGRALRQVDVRTGRVEVLGEDGEWNVEAPGAAD